MKNLIGSGVISNSYNIATNATAIADETTRAISVEGENAAGIATNTIGVSANTIDIAKNAAAIADETTHYCSSGYII
jgi:hypothetical protein